MKSLDDILDSIRISPSKNNKNNKNKFSNTEARDGVCEWDSCDKAGAYRAPKGRDGDGQYFNFCLKHVREYNKSYNYFSNLNNDEVKEFNKQSLSGHRPTWDNEQLKPNWNEEMLLRSGYSMRRKIYGGQQARLNSAVAQKARKTLHDREVKALNILGLDDLASAEEIKARYKLLIKKHHPDTISLTGDAQQIELSQERLRSIIKAYKLLTKSGIVKG